MADRVISRIVAEDHRVKLELLTLKLGYTEQSPVYDLSVRDARALALALLNAAAASDDHD